MGGKLRIYKKEGKRFDIPMLTRPLNQGEIAVANIALSQRKYIIALSAIVAALPKESINREAVRKNIADCQLFEGLAGKDDGVKKEVETLVDQILGPA